MNPDTKEPNINTTTTDPPPYPTPPSSPIDSSMTLVILICATALVFVGFFAVLIRRSAASAAAAAAAYRSSAPTRPRVKAGVGLDQAAVDSLPVVAYGEAAKQRMISIDECTICLSEFGEGESVKVIPCCGHVFHPKCVDTWLGTHVTCPLCRSDELFGDGRGEEVCLDVERCRSDDSRNQS